MNGFAYQIVIATTIEKAWAALIDPEFTRKFWFGRSVISDWKVGSSVAVVTPEGATEAKGVVVEFEPPKRLSYTWISAAQGPEERTTTVVFELQELGPLVKLSILHDIDANGAKFQQAAAGWTFILSGLKTLLETGKSLPSIPWKKG
jgi:uncharacterized protein YndB with AHSA1/START domain